MTDELAEPYCEIMGKVYQVNTQECVYEDINYCSQCGMVLEDVDADKFHSLIYLAVKG